MSKIATRLENNDGDEYEVELEKYHGDTFKLRVKRFLHARPEVKPLYVEITVFKADDGQMRARVLPVVGDNAPVEFDLA